MIDQISLITIMISLSPVPFSRHGFKLIVKSKELNNQGHSLSHRPTVQKW